MQDQSASAPTVQSSTPRWFERPTVWFWSAIAIGAAIRLYLVVFTEGTSDVELWEENARGVHQLGLINYYHAEPTANHPPFIFEVESLLSTAATTSGIPFRILLRAPFAIIDAGTMFLLLSLLPASRYRFLAAAGYWLNPLSIIFSAYHGNTDSAVAFLLLLCVSCLAREKIAIAGLGAGAVSWIKLAGVLALPAVVLFLQGWRKRIIFLASFGLVVLTGYLPALIQDPRAVYVGVFGYRGIALQSVAGIPVWGMRVLFFSLFAPPPKWPGTLHVPADFIMQNSWQISIVLLLIVAWLRRSRRTVPELCATIAGMYLMIYGFSDNWSFQYFAWALPFWFFLGPYFYTPAILLASAYIYSLYWLLCGNGWLQGSWDFVGHPYWPPVVIVFRNLAFLFFFVSACLFLIFATRRQPIEFRHQDQLE